MAVPVRRPSQRPHECGRVNQCTVSGSNGARATAGDGPVEKKNEKNFDEPIPPSEAAANHTFVLQATANEQKDLAVLGGEQYCTFSTKQVSRSKQRRQ